MGGQTEPTRQSDEILPPILPICLALTTVVVVVDLTTIAQTPMLPASSLKGSEHTNPLGQYLTMVADANCNVVFGATAAALASVTTAAVNTVVGNAIQANANTTITIAAGARFDFRLPPGPTFPTTGPGAGTAVWGSSSPARFMAALTPSGTATLRMWVSSR
jgi:hypothetical protein